MIITLFIEKIFNILLFPVDVINFGVNWLLGIDWVVDVVNVISYVLPWENILPLIIGTISIFVFRITIAVLRVVTDILPG